MTIVLTLATAFHFWGGPGRNDKGREVGEKGAPEWRATADLVGYGTRHNRLSPDATLSHLVPVPYCFAALSGFLGVR